MKKTEPNNPTWDPWQDYQILLAKLQRLTPEELRQYMACTILIQQSWARGSNADDRAEVDRVVKAVMAGATADVAASYRKVHAAVCVRRHTSDQCVGVIAIDRNGVTLKCPVCGCVGQVYADTICVARSSSRACAR